MLGVGIGISLRFRSLAGGGTPTYVIVDATGEATVICRSVPAPRVLLDVAGWAFVIGADPGLVLTTDDGWPLVTDDGAFVLTSE